MGDYNVRSRTSKTLASENRGEDFTLTAGRLWVGQSEIDFKETAGHAAAAIHSDYRADETRSLAN